MQIGFFFVRLRDSTADVEDGLAQRTERATKFLDWGAPYPVLAVHCKGSDLNKETFYHMPTKNNELWWFPSQYFEFARQP